MKVSVILFLAANLVGCGSDRSVPPGIVNVAGNWTGELQSTARTSDSGGFNIFVAQTAATLNGPRASLFMSTLCGANKKGTMTGTIDAGQLKMTVVIPPDPTIVNLNLTVVLTGHSDGTTISGTYSVADGCGKGDVGNFQLSRVPPITSSQWTGYWYLPDAIPLVNTAANLVEDAAGKITGTLTLDDNYCDDIGVDPSGNPVRLTGPLNVTGTMTGVDISLQSDTPTSQWLAYGFFTDLAGKQLHLDHVCIGSTDAISIDLTRP